MVEETQKNGGYDYKRDVEEEKQQSRFHNGKIDDIENCPNIESDQL